MLGVLTWPLRRLSRNWDIKMIGIGILFGFVAYVVSSLMGLNIEQSLVAAFITFALSSLILRVIKEAAVGLYQLILRAINMILLIPFAPAIVFLRMFSQPKQVGKRPYIELALAWVITMLSWVGVLALILSTAVKGFTWTHDNTLAVAVPAIVLTLLGAAFFYIDAGVRRNHRFFGLKGPDVLDRRFVHPQEDRVFHVTVISSLVALSLGVILTLTDPVTRQSLKGYLPDMTLVQTYNPTPGCCFKWSHERLTYFDLKNDYRENCEESLGELQNIEWRPQQCEILVEALIQESREIQTKQETEGKNAYKNVVFGVYPEAAKITGIVLGSLTTVFTLYMMRHKLKKSIDGTQTQNDTLEKINSPSRPVRDHDSYDSSYVRSKYRRNSRSRRRHL